MKAGYKILKDGVEYTFGDSDHNIFTGQITDMAALFGSTGFEDDIGYWDTSKVTDMNSMFFSNWDFNQDIGDWDTSKVTDMGFMFFRARGFGQDLSGWNVINVTEKHNFDRETRTRNWPRAKKPVWGTTGKK